MALDILAEVILSQNVIEFFSIICRLFERKSVKCFENCDNFFCINVIPSRLISNILDFQFCWICFLLLLNCWELMKKRKQRNFFVNSHSREQLPIYRISSMLLFYIECHHQGSFISPYLSQVVSHLFALNIPILLIRIYVFHLKISVIFTTIELLSLLLVFQFPDEN